MAYVTNADIENRLGTRTYVQLTDDEGTGSADTDKVDEARLGAEGEVDSYLARRHAVPIDVATHTELAGVLASITLDIVAFRLHCRRPPVPAEILTKHDAAIDWLRQVAAGTVVLPADSALPDNAVRGPHAEVGGQKRVFTEETLESL